MKARCYRNFFSIASGVYGSVHFITVIASEHRERGNPVNPHVVLQGWIAASAYASSQ